MAVEPADVNAVKRRTSVYPRHYTVDCVRPRVREADGVGRGSLSISSEGRVRNGMEEFKKSCTKLILAPSGIISTIRLRGSEHGAPLTWVF